MIEERVSEKITILISKSMSNRLKKECYRLERPKSNLLRVLLTEYLNRAEKFQ